jgi:hypothetical protein
MARRPPQITSYNASGRRDVHLAATGAKNNITFYSFFPYHGLIEVFSMRRFYGIYVLKDE